MIDWRGFAFPKSGKVPSDLRRSRRRAAMVVANADRDQRTMMRHGGRCAAYGVSPVCWEWAMDPHELIPVSQGGPRVSWNREPLCRMCHRMVQGTVGGVRLIFDWPGKDEGAMPNADRHGNVKVRWRR